jgi:hypothetical protein
VIRRPASTLAGALLALAVAVTAAAQGKSGQPHGKPAAPPPTTTTVPASTAKASPAPTDSRTIAPGNTRVAPFSWMDDASLTAPGTVWVGVSAVSWHGGGVHEVVAPAFDGSLGLTRRLQLGASVPRVAGGVGTSFYSAKVGVLTGDTSTVKVAITPTIEVLSSATMQAAGAGEGRMHLGLPVSVQVERRGSRIYGSSGYFSPGIWYAGAGIARAVTEKLGVSVSCSRAWTRGTSGLPPELRPRRNDLSGGASFDLTPNVAVYGSLGRTLATAAENGAGTTLSFGVSLSATPIGFTK